MKRRKTYVKDKLRSGLSDSFMLFTRKKLCIVLTVFLIGLFLTGSLYRLKAGYMVITMFVGFACVPPILMYYSIQRNENMRFNDVDIYLHQMAYSFQRHPKINIALSDTVKVINGDMRDVINDAITELELSGRDDVYSKALKIIEETYPCPRIKTLHKFLISIEERGGNYYNSLNVLISDYDRWVKRVYKYQKDMARVKKNSVIGVILSGCLATASLLISLILGSSSGIEMDITGERLYQVVSTIFIIVNIVYFLVIEVCCNKDWLQGKRTEEAVMKDYRLVFGKGYAGVKKFSYIIALICLTVAAVASVISPVFIFFGVLVGVYMLFVPALNKKNAFARLKEDVYIAFSEWLRDVVINLQEMPLQAAINETYEDCPAIMRADLEEFICQIDDNPSDVMPYYIFMSRYSILDISSTVKTLYSVAELESENSDRVLNTLIKRNYEMVDKHEEISNEDSISVMKFSEYIPMVFVSMKLCADMLLIITNYL